MLKTKHGGLLIAIRNSMNHKFITLGLELGFNSVVKFLFRKSTIIICSKYSFAPTNSAFAF